MRDPIRLFFALAGPIILMITVGYGISFDVDELSFAVFDQDQTPESRRLAEQFTAIAQFAETAPVESLDALEARMKAGALTVALEIPEGAGRMLHQGKVPEVSLWVDGSMPFRAETARGYALGALTRFAAILAEESGTATPSPVTLETRFRFNQAFRSANAMLPSVIMLILILIPAVMSAIGVVREVETGTIANFRSTPVRRVEFLLGKQIPYIALSALAFAALFALGQGLFQVPFTGSLGALTALALLYVCATTGLGQLISTFTKTQVSAVFAVAVISIIPTVNFSGLIVPVSSLETAGRLTGLAFPGAWFQTGALGTFLKGFGWADIGTSAAAIAGFAALYLAAAVAILRKQEP
ncbi:ABC transporter permease [Rhodobacter xanthinilyticus]|uniref:ABC transporter permease n=1 Tax=Rhodobacter xanthinilyticus TaxID=1850250 RepID=UPI002E8DD35D|nr:ABC transporter permease [Rhodobacter xanthinilyticus]